MLYNAFLSCPLLRLNLKNPVSDVMSYKCCLSIWSDVGRQCLRYAFVWKHSSLSKCVGSVNEYAELMHKYAALQCHIIIERPTEPPYNRLLPHCWSRKCCSVQPPYELLIYCILNWWPAWLIRAVWGMRTQPCWEGGVADTESTLICWCLCPGPVMECESGKDEK